MPPDWLKNVPLVGTWLDGYWHRLAASREELVALLEKHGFVCERVEDTLFGMGFIVVAKKPQAAAPDSPKPTLLQGAPDAVS